MKNQLTALIVEDNASVRDLIVFALRRIDGLTTVEASHGVDALERLEDISPDIIITDINMPVMDGLSLLKHVRSREHLADIPILVITTEQAAADKARAIALGATSYITKPIRAPRLLQEVNHLLERDRTRAAQ
ncbi:MAG: response regulator [Myxococcota bacterium]